MNIFKKIFKREKPAPRINLWGRHMSGFYVRHCGHESHIDGPNRCFPCEIDALIEQRRPELNRPRNLIKRGML